MTASVDAGDRELYAWWTADGMPDVAGAVRQLAAIMRDHAPDARRTEGNRLMPRIASILQSCGGRSLHAAHIEAAQVVIHAEFLAADLDEAARERSQRMQLKTNGTDSLIVEKQSAVFERVKRQAEHPPVAIQTPFPTLNHFCFGGFRRGELIYLGGRPGVGKSAMAALIATYAVKRGIPSLLVTQEMSPEQLGARITAQDAGISAESLRTGQGVDWQRLIASGARQYGWPLYVTSTAHTLELIDEAMTRVPQIGLVIVDYLQILTAPPAVRDRRHQVEALSKGLRQLALTRDVVMLVLSALSRPMAGTKDEPPTLASLRESGALEHDADIVMLLHKRKQATETECAVLKNRSGRVGQVELIFDPRSVGFIERVSAADEDGERRYGN